jgi:hypothetical protein
MLRSLGKVSKYVLRKSQYYQNKKVSIFRPHQAKWRQIQSFSTHIAENSKKKPKELLGLIFLLRNV